eukprot:6686397-Lingulodinium_polyedra.AAC.1
MAIDGLALTQRRTWPTFTAQSSKALVASRVLLQECQSKDRWSLASRCWMSCLLPRGVVVQKPKDPNFYISLGPVGHMACMAWGLKRHSLPGQHNALFQLSTQAPDRMPWLVVLDLADYMVVPTTPVAPVHAFELLGRKLGQSLGIVLQQVGKPVPMAVHAARQAFWQVPGSELEKLLGVLGLPPVPAPATAFAT